MDKKFLKAKDIAQLWGITPRRVNQLCTAGFINGAYKEGRYWLIPSDTTKPEILRNKQNPPLSGRLLPCPVGITSYKEVSKECYYVDKTLLIKDIIDDHSKVYLFTRPRRFGKTLTMDMIRTYFEKTSTDTSIYFSDKKIWDCGDAYKQLQGTYPVIFLSFKDAHQTNWADMYRSLCFTLKEEFLRHIELLSSKAINEYDKKYIHNLINDVADSTDYQFALGKLSSLLATHYNQKVIIIIDEYDTPIQQGHLYHYYNEGKEQIQWRRVSLFSKKLTIRKHQERVVRKEKSNTLWAHVIDVQIYSRSRRHSQYSLEDPVQSATSYAAYLYDYESLFSNRNHNPLSKPNR